MHILRIEHLSKDYETWKAAFDGDPIGRERSGVRRHVVQRSVEDPNYVLIDLEFDDVTKAQTMLGSLREMWGRVDVVTDPQARIVEVVEARDY